MLLECYLINLVEKNNSDVITKFVNLAYTKKS